MKRKITLIFLVMSLLVGVCSCGKSKEGGTTGKKNTDFYPDVTSSEEFTVVEPLEAGALADYPLLVGGSAHGAENIEILNDLELGNFVWIPKKDYGMGYAVWDEKNGFKQDVNACVKNDLYYMVTHLRGLGVETKAGGYNMGGNTDPLGPDTKEVQDYIKNKGGKLFVGYHAEELDADWVQSSIKAVFADRIQGLFDFETPGQARIKYENELARLKKQANDMGGRLISNQCMSHHLNAFRANNEIVIAELLEHLPTTELQLAYLRGGANQFGGDFGVWVSPWYDGVPSADTGLWVNPLAQPGMGHKSSSFRRCIYESYVSGARIITAQETEPLFARDGRGGYQDVLWGTELKNFWKYAKNHQERMTPIVSTAIMIDRDNGWEPGHFGGFTTDDTVWGKLPLQLGDKMLGQYMNTFLPGYARTEDAQPNRKDLYPGFFASTPAGPFDMIATDCSVSRMSKYPLLILMGDIKMNPTLLENLKKYVSQGGTLVINGYQSMYKSHFVEDPEFYGFQFANFSDNWLLGDRISPSGLIKLNQEMPYINKKSFSDEYACTLTGLVKGAEIIATDANSNPAVVRNQFGKGKVYLTLTEYMMNGYGTTKKQLSFYNEFLRSLALSAESPIKAMPATVNGTDDFAFIASYQGDSSIVACITNHGNKDGFVTLTVKGTGLTVKVDVGPKEVTTEEKNGETLITVKAVAEDVTLVRITL